MFFTVPEVAVSTFAHREGYTDGPGAKLRGD